MPFDKPYKQRSRRSAQTNHMHDFQETRQHNNVSITNRLQGHTGHLQWRPRHQRTRFPEKKKSEEGNMNTTHLQKIVL